MGTNEITLKSKADIDSQTYNKLIKYVGNGQITSLDYKTITLRDVEVINKFNYSMTVKDTYDNSDVEFIFNVFKLHNELFLLYVKHDIKFYFEIKETIQEVKERHTWFIQMMVEFHKAVLL